MNNEPISFVMDLRDHIAIAAFQKDSYVHVYSRSVKSLKAIIRRNLKEN